MPSSSLGLWENNSTWQSGYEGFLQQIPSSCPEHIYVALAEISLLKFSWPLFTSLEASWSCTMDPGKCWACARKGENGRVTAARPTVRWTWVWSWNKIEFLYIHFCAARISLWLAVCHLTMSLGALKIIWAERKVFLTSVYLFDSGDYTSFLK